MQLTLPHVKSEKDIILVGGGHTHALVLKQWSMRPPEGVRVTLISEASESPYSGMLPGVIAGHYSPDMIHIDLRRLCDLAGARFIRASVTGLDLENRRVMLEGRPPVAFDRASLNVGATPDLSIPGAGVHVIPVKPIAHFWASWQRVLTVLTHATSKNITVVGGGAGGVEVVMAIAHRLKTLGLTHAVQLVTAGAAPLLDAPRRLQTALAAQLQALGIGVVSDFRVAEVGPCYLKAESGVQVASDHTFWCTQSRSPSWLAETGLPCTPAGFVRIDANLKSIGVSSLFAVGDCAWQDPSPSPRAGVYAVRQAPILAANLVRDLQHRPLLSYRPQRHFLSLLACGDRFALGHRGLMTVQGSSVWWLKDRIDRRFMAMFPTRAEARSPIQAAQEGAFTEAVPQCGGCAAKLGEPVLRQALSEGAGGYLPEDAAVMSINPDTSGGMALVQSVDGLRPLVSDPWLMGRLATIHALSDLAAMGCAPHSAQCLAVLPSLGQTLQARDLQQILAGVRQELHAVGAVLSGGHSMEGETALLGLTVNGFSKAEQLVPKRGARVGDILCLTKPLGVGVLFAAAMRGRARAEWLDTALESMLVQNAPAASLCRQERVNALTDVTGFGLLGHLLEMLGEGLDAELNASALPALSGVLDCLNEGIESSLAPSNREAGCRLTQANGIPPARSALLYDPQTCGGLLIAVAPEQLPGLRTLFAGAQLPLFEIGGVRVGQGGVHLLP